MRGERSWNRVHRAAALALLIAGIGPMARAGGESLSGGAPGRRAPAPGEPAPLFSARTLSGRRLSLASLRGHVVLLNFWSPVCPPCRIEMPELERIHRLYSSRGLEVIGITEMDPPRDQVTEFLGQTGATYTILFDPGARIASLYALEAHPTSIVIDARGIVRYTNVGFLRGEEKEIERAVLEAQEHRP